MKVACSNAIRLDAEASSGEVGHDNLSTWGGSENWGAVGEKPTRSNGAVVTSPGTRVVAVAGDGCACMGDRLTGWASGHFKLRWAITCSGLGIVTSSKYSKYFPNYLNCSHFKNTKHYLPMSKKFPNFAS
jgi:phosphoketolase